MLAAVIFAFALGTIWVVVGGGLMVGGWRGRRRRFDISREEALPWEELLKLLENRNRARAAEGKPPEQVTGELLNELVAQLPAPLPGARPVDWPEDREFQLSGAAEKRICRRRWGNWTEIFIRCYLWTGEVHGLVVNRSTGGLGIYLDRDVPEGTPLRIRALEAPASTPMARAEVRHCRKVGRGFFLGCEF